MHESIDRGKDKAQPPVMPPSDHELKFTVCNNRIPRIVAWLESVCRSDPEHPRATVSSIYFDTLRWRTLGKNSTATT